MDIQCERRNRGVQLVDNGEQPVYRRLLLLQCKLLLLQLLLLLQPEQCYRQRRRISIHTPKQF
jgi:hypothetical protein